ncbi:MULTISPECIES: 5'-nucleotidase C-terminal domain-containing protein [Roseobacteraceae]|uniref:Trifunctional nucleotide phosphoesterase protein YfkN n=1 Tax=Pseudosulfitobacter pseudonitzschiae TaxID=1402135 RepID=A0A221K3I7_9RHOB|nr:MULTISPECIES: 5'-nucleotidase C-terminal domain-containing protein [Roseobacteraceae]ASM73568.1 trifunctional nucleotide phosphoesterase protein YfkN [Pseudosulfitobacter pseudonitzschiae]
MVNAISPLPPPDNGSVTAELCILATSDIHMQLTAHDHTLDITRPTGGLSRVVTLIEQARAARPDALVLTLDNGDLLQGAAMADVMTTPAHLAQHPITACLALAGYDAIGLGNHDVDHGLHVTHRLLKGANCPVLSANFESAALPFLRPYTLLRRKVRGDDGALHPVCIGVISALPEQTGVWNYLQLNQSARIVDPMARLAALIPQMKSEGADLIVVLAHAGIVPDTAADRDENFALSAARLPDVTAIICGHTHLSLPGPDHRDVDGVDANSGQLDQVPAVMPGFAARALGVIDIKLERTTNGWQVCDSHCTLHATSEDTPEHPAILQATAAASRLTQAHMGEPVGHTDMHLHSFFAYVRADHATHLLAHGMKRAVRIAVRDTAYQSLPILAATCTTAKGGTAGPQNFLNVPPGVIQRRHVAMILPYSDMVWAVCATGAEILEWLERCAIAFEHLRPDIPDQTLTRRDVPGFLFDVISGLTVTFDPTQPPRYCAAGRMINPRARRVASAHWNGSPIDHDQQFLVAANSFRLAGGGGFPGLSPDKIALRTDVSVTAAALHALAEGPAPAMAADTWRFKTGLGVTAVLQTAPEAMPLLDQIADLAPAHVGITDAGFLKLRISM